MDSSSLESITWHDLPLESISISCHGLELLVTPFCEATQSYLSCRLILTKADSLSVNLSGEPMPNGLSQLEISGFTYTHSSDDSGRVSGQIGILAGNAGYWEFAFVNAHWQLDEA
jgi:hypothetical protein